MATRRLQHQRIGCHICGTNILLCISSPKAKKTSSEKIKVWIWWFIELCPSLMTIIWNKSAIISTSSTSGNIQDILSILLCPPASFTLPSHQPTVQYVQHSEPMTWSLVQLVPGCWTGRQGRCGEHSPWVQLTTTNTLSLFQFVALHAREKMSNTWSFHRWEVVRINHVTWSEFNAKRWGPKTALFACIYRIYDALNY